MRCTIVALFIAMLIVMLPICAAETLSTLSYNANGNLITGDGKYREYDSENHLVRIRDGNTAGSAILEEYIYDHEGIRIITIDLVNNQTIYTPTKEMMKIVNASGEFDFTYIYEGDMLIARKDSDGNVLYYHPDHLGSVSLISNESGDVVEETFYKPFGGIDGSTPTEETRVGYTGHELDESTGQVYMEARYYSPGLRQFTQADTLLPNIYDSQQLNRYMYVRGNPFRFIDPGGRIISEIVNTIRVILNPSDRNKRGFVTSWTTDNIVTAGLMVVAVNSPMILRKTRLSKI